MDPNPPTKEEVEKMIGDAITQHNWNASLISMCIGFFLLGAFMDGLLRMLGVVPPFMHIDISLINNIAEKLGIVLE